MKKRNYYYIEGKDPAKSGQLKYIQRDIECDDSFDDELVMMAFPIGLMKEISSVLSHFGLRDDAEYFYSECREVVSVPEKHINSKGQGKVVFQSYFHKFPESVEPFFEDAIIVVILHPQPSATAGGPRDYNMIAYIHVNHIDFKSPDGQLHKGYYYNILRLSEREVNGKTIYRRKRIFTTMFSILFDITLLNDIHFAYATMGKENQAITDALKMNSERLGKQFETFPMRNNTKVNLLYGSSSAAKKLVDISHNKEALKEYYEKLYHTRSRFMFYQMHSEENFLGMIRRILASSPTSRVFMIPDAKGNMDAAGIIINWGDYISLKLQNPKGLFKVIDMLQFTEKILYPNLLVGSPKGVKLLTQGVAYKYRKEHKVHLTILNAHEGDPHFDLKKSMIFDPFVYFVIHDRPEMYKAMKEHSKDEAGNIRLFIETPLL